MWYIPYERIARWDRFSRPEKLPKYAIGFPTVWWWDEEKAKKVADRMMRFAAAGAALLLVLDPGIG